VAEVSIDRLRSGSILQKDVLLESGALLIREGTVVNDRQIQLMKQRGVRSVSIVEADDVEVSTEVTPLVLAERTKRLETAFAPVEQVPHMAGIREAARDRLRLRRPWE